MFQRDYIMRMIEQLTQFAAQLAGLRREMKHDQALQLIDEHLGRFFRLNTRLANSLTESDLLAMMSSGGYLETDKVLGVALLLKEEGDIHRDLNHPEESYPRHVKALQLYLAADERGAELGKAGGKERIDELAEALKRYRLPSEVRGRLFRYYDRERRFDEAENWLFDWREAEPEAAVREGNAFYEKLLAESPEALAAGGLPIEEVHLGIEDLTEGDRRGHSDERA